MGRADLAGAARLELVSGVAQLRPEEAMFDAMLRGLAGPAEVAGLRDETAGDRERLIRRPVGLTGAAVIAWTRRAGRRWPASAGWPGH
jgi:integrase/recombinase XerC